MTNNFVNDPITWPPGAATQENQPQMTDEELMKKRLEDSKYEQKED